MSTTTEGSTNSTDVISADLDPALFVTLTVASSVSLLGCFLATVSKVTFRFVIPIAWKCCLFLQDVASVALCIGLILVASYTNGASDSACRAAGFFLLFGLLDLLFGVAFLGLTLVVIQNPSKMSQLSTFSWGLFLGIVLPEKAVAILLSILPVMPIDYFDTETPYPLVCFPFRQEGDKGATFGAIVFFIMWGLVAFGLILCVANAVKFCTGPSTRIHASSPSLWQMQKMEQGRTLHKFSLLELALVVVVMFVVTIVTYTNSSSRHLPQWITMLALAVVALVHAVLSLVQLGLWSGLCCDKTAQKKEPHHRLKRLELIKIDGPGKLRLKASWTAGKGVWRRGLLKVYGPSHIKAWAQEIVVLGLLRKSQSASVLQCLWTSNTNPYYESMTLISGDIVTSDSRLTCLEMTSSGTLQDLLKSMEVPLPEPCQKTIMHDIAEGLSYLHDQNVLHRNLTSAAVYLKGSVHCLVLRAAVGDFEDAQIYGTLLTGSPTSTISRKRFFLPDIRAYALVGLEMLGQVCQCRQRDKQPHRRTAVMVSSSGKDATNRKLKHAKDNPQHHGKILSYTGNITASMARAGDKRNTPTSVPYFAPGEVECATIHEVNNAKGESTSHKDKSKQLPPTRASSRRRNDFQDSRAAENVIDENWKLRSNTKPSEQNVSDESGFQWQEFNSYDDRYKHSQTPGITQVKETHQYEFPDHSVFKTSQEGEDLDMIEEEIERGHHGVQLVAKHGVYKQAGYVTAKTEDGREIFIPAAYKQKSSGNSSSGYGSCGGSAPSSDVGIGSSTYASDVPHQVHKTSSAATVSSFGGDDVLEVLPGMADVEEHRPRKGEQLLRELMKAKHDAKIEQLIECYEERVRRGELAPNLEGLPIGVVFPKKNRQQQLGNGQMLVNSSYNAGPNTRGLSTETKPREQTTKGKLSSPRPRTAQSSMTERLQTERPNRPMSASSSSFYAWNARSSLKRNKARTALKKALSMKGTGVPRRSEFDQGRGMRGKEVEIKYSNRPGSARSATSDIVVPDYVNIDSKNKDVSLAEVQTVNNVPTVRDTIISANSGEQDGSHHPSSSVKNKQSLSDSKPFIGPTQKPNVARKPSTKSKPAPQPPSIPPKPVVPVSPSKSENVNQPASSTHSTNKGNPQVSHHKERPMSPSAKSPRKDTTVHTGLQQMSLSSPSPLTSVQMTEFETDPLPQPTNSSLVNESFTSTEPASSESSSAPTSSFSNNDSNQQPNPIDKIQSDMNNIIQQSNPAAVAAHANGSVLPPGIRLIDSGFDSAHSSSEEDEECICATAALQAAEDGSCSCASEVFSQVSCSCACSNCLSPAQGYNNNQSWTGSQDSETWSNSNSFSSYEANMYRRKLPSKRHETPGCVLAPDEQYPSPVHHYRGMNTLHPRPVYSPKRNRHSLHTKGHYQSSPSDTSSVASKRYRELVKKGVPMRVSVVSGENDGLMQGKGSYTEKVSSVDHPSHTMDQTTGSLDAHNSLVENLENQGFFNSDPKSLPAFQNNLYNSWDQDDGYEEDRYQGLSPIPSLEEIIKEIPDETGNYSEEAKAFLNRPESELSVKALQAVLSRHGSSTENQPNTELIIDRIFSQNAPHDDMASSSPFPGNGGNLDLDEDAIREVAMLPGGTQWDEPLSADLAGLLAGMDGRHIRYCQNISSCVNLINMAELLPASPQAFDQLKARLKLSGNFGIIGTQILELLRMCWLNDVPPTTAAIVDQLTDHVTETEL